jgi:hypothetical protein
MSTTGGHGHDNTTWVLGKVIEHRVYRDPDHEYRVDGATSELTKTCCAAVYALEEAGLVALGRDGTVEATAEGVRWHGDHTSRRRDQPSRKAPRKAAPATFQAA